MATPTGVYLLNQFKGLNRLGDIYNMAPAWAWDLKNGYLKKTEDGRGSIQQRGGLTKYNTTTIGATTKIRYQFEAKWNSGSRTNIIRAGTAWYKYNTGTSDYDSLDGSRGADAQGQAVMWENQLVMTDGGVPRKCSSAFSVSNLSTDAAMPTDATAVHVHKFRMWLNSAGSPMKVYGSKVSDATSATAWSASNDAVTLDLSHVLPVGDTVIGFDTAADTLLVIYCKNNVVIYNAPTTYTSIELVQKVPVSCLSRFGCVSIGNQICFPSLMGVKNLQSSTTTQRLDVDDLSKLINPYYRDLIANTSDKTSICGVFSNMHNHYYLTIHDSHETNTLVYSSDFGNYVGRYTFHVNPYSWMEGFDGTLYIGGDNGFVYTYSDTVYTDDSVTIPFVWQTPYLGIDTPDRFKSPRELQALIKTNLAVSIFVDYWYPPGDKATASTTLTLTMTPATSQWGSAEWGVAPWGGQLTDIIKNYDLIGRGQLIGLKVYHNTNGANINIAYLFLKTILEGNK